MDGCSLSISLADFCGTIIIAASPSLYVENLERAVVNTNCKSFSMPALSEEEALDIAKMIGVEEKICVFGFAPVSPSTKSNALYFFKIFISYSPR